jgi:DNA polymerase III epsilon subunit-like protein
MSEIVYYPTDLETSGLKVGVQEVTEIGIIRAKDRVQLWRNVKCERPEAASFDALKITGKTIEDLSKGFSKEQVVEECNEFFSKDGLEPANRCIVGHNIFSFDRRWLFDLWGSCGKEFPAFLWLDTIPMIRAYAKKIGLVKPKVNLHAACDIVGIKKVAAKHDAKHDSQNSYLLWKDLVENKKMDFLPFVKTSVHSLVPAEDSEECGLDPSLLDI